MKLQSLKLKNFKGIKTLELVADGGNIKIYGDNATGKTTIFDAFLWLLFDKDSQNKTDFAIKTLDKNGEVIHHLDHEVEGAFDIDGETIVLRKVYREKWTKRRGSAVEEFTGHETDYFVDGVPVKKSEYTEYIEQIAPEETFKLLTSPTYFNEQMHWTDRRDLLIEMAGDVSMDDVVKANPRLSKLPGILGKRDPDKHKKAVMEKRKMVNDELERIPIRIDEVTQGMPDISMIEDPKSIEGDLKKLADGKAKKESKLAKLLSGGDLGDKKQKIAEIESKLLTIETSHKRDVSSKADVVQDKINDHNRYISNLRHGIDGMDKRKDELTKDIEGLTKKMDELRDEWHEVNGQAFEPCVDETCPTCGQDLPTDKVQEARDKAIALFNAEKAKRLESINTIGKQMKEDRDTCVEGLEFAKKQKVDMEKSLEQAIEISAELQSELAKIESTMDVYKELPEYKKLIDERDMIQKAIDGDQSAIEPEKARLEDEIEKIGQAIDALNEAKARLELHKQAKDRIAELEEQERTLAKEFERLEQELFLIEEYIRTKADLLTDNINSKFKLAKFVLFEEQVNGGVKEVCETTYNGVPYSSGLNNAARINVGLDIINTLSEHFGFSAPVFIDNREAVTELIDVNAQVISLIVSEKDKTLRIEKPDHEAKQQSLFEEAV